MYKGNDYEKYYDIERYALIYKGAFVNESTDVDEASSEEGIAYHDSYLKLGEYLEPYIMKADKHRNAGHNVISAGGKAMSFVEAMFAMAEYILSRPDAEDWQKEVAKKVSQLGARKYLNLVQDI